MTDFDLVKNAGRIRREQEIAEHGKQVWLRKGGIHHSPKEYHRSKMKQETKELINE